jgi:hypothetical protein
MKRERIFMESFPIISLIISFNNFRREIASFCTAKCVEVEITLKPQQIFVNNF